MFNKFNRSFYDCFICTFHDQALIAFKLINEFKGVNYTGSLDIIRTAPDHGTAYDLINTNKDTNGEYIKGSNLLADDLEICKKFIPRAYRFLGNNGFKLKKSLFLKNNFN